jgi:hypothetical protein
VLVVVGAGPGATFGAFHWAASERDTLREHFSIRYVILRRGILKRTNEDAAQAARTRECHGFLNPRGLRVRVYQGAGAGWPKKPWKNPHPWQGFDGF